MCNTDYDRGFEDGLLDESSVPARMEDALYGGISRLNNLLKEHHDTYHNGNEWAADARYCHDKICEGLIITISKLKDGTL